MVGIDLQAVDPIPGATLIVGDGWGAAVRSGFGAGGLAFLAWALAREGLERWDAARVRFPKPSSDARASLPAWRASAPPKINYGEYVWPPPPDKPRIQLEDIVLGRDGQYRVRIKDNKSGADCGYPGVEVLADGTFVLTTYGHWIEGEQPFILSAHLSLGELDRAARRKR